MSLGMGVEHAAGRVARGGAHGGRRFYTSRAGGTRRKAVLNVAGKGAHGGRRCYTPRAVAHGMEGHTEEGGFMCRGRGGTRRAGTRKKAVLYAAGGGHTEAHGGMQFYMPRAGGHRGGGRHTEECGFTSRGGAHDGTRRWVHTSQLDRQYRPAWAAFIRRCAPIYARRLGSPQKSWPKRRAVL